LFTVQNPHPTLSLAKGEVNNATQIPANASAATALPFLTMPETSDLDVGYVAKLARLNLTDEDTRLFQKQLGDVLKYAEKLKEVDVSDVEASAHAIPVFNVFREDEPRDWFTTEEALGNAPQKANNLFIVTKVVE
jgi:aspartyl-tRNA(Asn)/glutamyl-tRNA(Gln) amidotransferase subunit C